jgi:hypothetical protein
MLIGKHVQKCGSSLPKILPPTKLSAMPNPEMVTMKVYLYNDSQPKRVQICTSIIDYY